MQPKPSYVCLLAAIWTAVSLCNKQCEAALAAKLNNIYNTKQASNELHEIDQTARLSNAIDVPREPARAHKDDGHYSTRAAGEEKDPMRNDDHQETSNRRRANEAAKSVSDRQPDQQPDIWMLVKALQSRFVEQVIRQRMADKDHLLMEKWLVDNINDLHRELKQTELDFEHYVRVTKNLMAQSEANLKRQLAARTMLPLSIPIGEDNTLEALAAAEGRGDVMANMSPHHRLSPLNLQSRFAAAATTHGQQHHLEKLLRGHLAR